MFSHLDRPDVGPDEFQFHDGKGADKDYGIKQWWDSLPPAERERVKKMAGAVAIAATATAICCCLK